jgi:Domain of unknown function (DUF4129)
MNGPRPHIRRSTRALVAALVLLCVAPNAHAISLADYRAQVSKADGAMSELLDLYERTEEDADAAATPQFKREEATLLSALRAALPGTEKVEWDGGTLAVDNRWLQQELDAFEKLPDTPVAPRAAALWRIDARTHALYQRLDETANATLSQPRDKTAEKGRLHAILQRPEYNQDAARGGALERLWERFLRWLRSFLPESKPMQPGTAMNLSRAARALIYSLCAALIIFVLWRYGPRLMRRKLTEKRERKARVILGERLAPDQTPADLLSEAERLARAGDLRGAMRKAYIAVLFELGERELLRLAPHKTNRDYLRALRQHARIFHSVQPLTNAYERHWYGLIPASAADWSEFQAGAKEVTSDKRV